MPESEYAATVSPQRWPEIKSKSTIKIKRMPGCLQTLWNQFWCEIPLTKSTAYQLAHRRTTSEHRSVIDG